MSTQPTTLSRTSTSKPPPPPTTTTLTTLIHPTANLTGTHSISLGPKAIIQLRSRLNSIYVPITIGSGSLVSERASIGYLSPPLAVPLSIHGPKSVTIGEGVIIESSAIVEAASIGAYTVVEVRAKIGQGAVIGANCKVCAMVEIAAGEVIDDDTVIWGHGWDERRVQRKEAELGGSDAGRRAVVEGLAETLKGAWTGK